MAGSQNIGINVVFTDLVGSTELSARLGPDATEALRVVHFGLLRAASEPHGGVEVKNLGDGLMLVFPSLGSALDASVEMQQAIERHNSSGKEPLGVRVGIATGDASIEAGDYFGEPVVEAARLCAKCDSGQIIVSQLTSLLARRSDHTFTSIGELDLKGVPEPVPSMTVDWQPKAAESTVAIPERLHPDMDLRIAGRSNYLDSLRQAFKDTANGAQRLTFLAGEPGIGKTRLCAELAADAHAQGALVLYGRCDEELGLAYQPWVEAIGYVLEHGPDRLIEQVISRHGAELSLIAPQIRRRNPEITASSSTDAETERYHLLQAVTSFISLVAEAQPVLLVLDDLHWADKQTLTMLRHVFTNGAAASLMIVGTYRDSDLEAGHPLIGTVAALRREAGVEQDAVRGLDDHEMVELVSISADHELDDRATAMALSLRQETAGNPFFAHEILRNLVEVGDLYIGDDGRWIVAKEFEELTLPQSVRDVVGQRIARMGDDILKALRAAAVVGKEFDLELLADITGQDEDDLLDLLESAISAGILAEVPGGVERFRFLHTLTRNTLQGELSDGRRRRLHRKIAESLETSFGANPGDRVNELATHWLAASAPIDGAKAIEYARMAGQQAELALAPDEAIRWFTSALENIEDLAQPDERLHTALLVELGTAQRNAGEADHRQTLLDAGLMAQRIGATQLMVAAALANGRGFLSKLGYLDAERVAALRASIEAVGNEPTKERAMLLACLASELEYAEAIGPRRAMIDEAMSIARRVDDPFTLGSVLNRFVVSFAVPQTLAERLELSVEACAIADELDDLGLRFWSACGAVQVAMAAGQREALTSALDRLQRVGSDSGRPSFAWVANNLTCTVQSVTGGFGEIERIATENLTLGVEAGEPDAFDYFGAALIASRWIEGRGMEIQGQLREAAERDLEVTAYPAALAELLAEGGETEQAAELLDAASELEFEYRVNNISSTALAGYAVAAERLGRNEVAPVLRRQLEPFSGQVICSRAFAGWTVDGVLARLAGMMGDHEQAEAWFESSAEMCADLGSSFFAASDDAARARMHHRRGAPDARERATYFAIRASDVASRHGFAAVERDARALLDEVAAA